MLRGPKSLKRLWRNQDPSHGVSGAVPVATQKAQSTEHGAKLPASKAAGTADSFPDKASRGRLTQEKPEERDLGFRTPKAALVPLHQTCPLTAGGWGWALGAFGLPSRRGRREGAGPSLTCAPQPEDEEDEEPVLEELEQREVLVLGLDGSGKSTFLRVLAGKPPLEGHIPTWGFNSVRLPTKDFEVDLLEIGGSQNLRFYWKEFVNEVDVLVFMVDSADRLRLPWARQELHKLLDKDPDLPVVVVANKQDLSEAMSMVELQQELGLQAVDNQREVFLLAASIAPAGPGFENPGTVHIWRLLLELLS
nr:ADP-ribosylation factor-like protein 10 [Vicugna pacos]